MSDGTLSQEEIDALLQDASGLEFDTPVPVAPVDLTDAQFQRFSSIAETATKEMGSGLAMLLGKSVSLGQPQIDQVNGEVLASNLDDEILNITLDFNTGDKHGFVMEPDLAINIASSIQGMEGVDLDDASINALQEGIQSMFTPLLNALSDSSGKPLMTNLPAGELQSKDKLDLSGKFIRIVYSLDADGEDMGRIIEYISADAIAVAFADNVPVAPQPAVEQQAPANQGGQQMQRAPQVQQPQMQQQQPQMQQQPPMQQMGNMGGAPSTVIQGVQFPDLSGGVAGKDQGNIGLLMDVSMEMTVELGRTKKLIKDILGMGEGTIIELDKLAGEPVDILVNHKLIAKGEVVVIDENFGVRVTEIVSPMERMNTIS